MTKEKTQKTKAFCVRIPVEQWIFIKRMSIVEEIPLSEIMRRSIELYRKKHENMLTMLGSVVHLEK